MSSTEISEAFSQPEPEVPSTALTPRDAAGRFAKRDDKEHVEKSKRFSRKYTGALQDVLLADPKTLEEPSTTVVEKVAKNLMMQAANAGVEDLSGASKALDVVSKWSGVDSKPAQEEFQMKVVLITAPNVTEGKDHTKFQKPTQPSPQFFKDNNLVEPDYIEAEVVSTNAPKPSVEIPAASQTAIDAAALSKSGGLYVPKQRS
jgi:hypothetical protein